MSDWIDAPGDALLSVRRQARAGARGQWVVVPREGGFVVQRTRPEDGTWQDAGSFGSIEDALAGTPGLRKLHSGMVSFFDLAAQADISVHDFAALLDLCPQESSDDSADWSEAELDACGWVDNPLWAG